MRNCKHESNAIISTKQHSIQFTNGGLIFQSKICIATANEYNAKTGLEWKLIQPKKQKKNERHETLNAHNIERINAMQTWVINEDKAVTSATKQRLKYNHEHECNVTMNPKRQSMQCRKQ